MDTKANNIPSNWVACQLKDLAFLKSGFTFKSNTYLEKGIPLIRISDISSGLVSSSSSVKVEFKKEFKKYLIEKNDILIAMSGATTGKFGIYLTNNPALQNQRVGNIKPYSENHLVQKFLFYFLFSAKKEIEKRAYGGAQPNISNEKIESLSFSLPPLNEQKRIVTKIEELFSELDKGVENLKKAQEQLKVYRQAVLKHAFEGKLTEKWREENKDKLESADQLLIRILKSRKENWNGRGKYKEPNHPEISKPPKLPSGWIWSNVNALISEPLTNGRSVPTAKKGFPVLRLTALKNRSIDLNERKVGAWQEEDAKPHLVKFGDFLASRGNGSKHLVGRGGLINQTPDPVAFPDTLIRIRINHDICQKEFFSEMWDSYFFRNQIEKKARTTAGIYKINQNDVASFILPLPSLNEQKEVIKILKDVTLQIDAMENWFRTELTKSETLRQSILKKAFSGELVPQDPNDEPASVLLERIKTVKAKQESSAKKTKTKSKSKRKSAA